MIEQLALPFDTEPLVAIYVLHTAWDDRPVYVGSTTLDPPQRRLDAHLNRWNAAHKVKRWVALVGADNVRMTVLYRVPAAQRHRREADPIRALRVAGIPLLNTQLMR